MAKFKWIQTNYPGVRYREHPTRKHGVGKDKYFAIRYQKGKGEDGKPIRKEEGLGWASQGWNANKALAELNKNREAAIKGEEGQRTMKERRDAAEAKERAKSRETVTFRAFYEKTYLPYAKREKKENTWSREHEIYRKWLEPAFGNMSLRSISSLDLQKLKSKMQKAGRSERTIQYALTLVRMIFNIAKREKFITELNPVSTIKMPKVDNGRLRFLTVDEAKRLLECLRARDMQTYEMALVALLTGMRFGEIAALTYQDLDIDNRRIIVRDPKNKGSRTVFMAEELSEVFRLKKAAPDADPGTLVFPHPKGGVHVKQPWAFRQAVKDAGLNNGITDRRLKFTFHGLRHTHGSWAAQNGVDVLTIKEMLGQKTLVMAVRYAHTSGAMVKSAVQKVAEMFNESGTHNELSQMAKI